MEGLKALTPEQMRALDLVTIQEYKIPGLTLMERAGAAVAQVVAALFENELAAPLIILAGKGNNGGDALVVARRLGELGIPNQVYLLGPKDKLLGDALANLEALEAKGREVICLSPENLDRLKAGLTQTDAVIDGIFGTGFHGPMKGLAAEVVGMVNDSGVPVIAIDIPSGLDGEFGMVSGGALKAAITVTMGLPKTGLLRGEGLLYAGRIITVDLGFSPEAIRKFPSSLSLIDQEQIADLFPPRSVFSHKGDLGRVLVIAGSSGMAGAAALAALGALRAGAGLVTVAVPQRVVPLVASVAPEIMVHPCPETEAGTLALKARDELDPFLARADAVVLGPGLGSHPQTGELVRELVGQFPRPLLLDADGLNLIAGDISLLSSSAGPRVLTPHPGEMSRLQGGNPVLLSDREKTVKKFIAEFPVVLILKGAGTMVGMRDRPVLVNPTGNPGMATAGAGDVLSGIVGAFLAGGIEPFSAAAAGVFVHGLSGDLAAARKGEISLIASDIIEFLPDAFASL